jgi:hypothetical protein
MTRIVVNDAACREVAQAGVEFMSGLGGAAGVHILDDMRGAIQHHNHLAFELGWQNRLHGYTVNNGRGRTKVLSAAAEPGPLTQKTRKTSSMMLTAIGPEAPPRRA